MSENSRTVYQGLLVPDERIKHANISAADSSYTQITSWPFSMSLSTICDPMKPPPPVTNDFIGLC